MIDPFTKSMRAHIREKFLADIKAITQLIQYSRWGKYTDKRIKTVYRTKFIYPYDIDNSIRLINKNFPDVIAKRYGRDITIIPNILIYKIEAFLK